MYSEKYRFDNTKSVALKSLPTSSKPDGVSREEIEELTQQNLLLMAELQEKLYADAREGLVVIFQALDAAGKDSTIKHVMGAMNPQGITVHSFKQPTASELAHDYLWRASVSLPKRGEISIFNRSYYEDVLITQVHNLQKSYRMPSRCIDDPDLFKKRYEQIRHYEEYLYENAIRVVKIFLNVSKEKQKERFLERLNIPEKNWKFSESDLQERHMFSTYHDVYAKVIEHTSTQHSPWYALPADHKWYTCYLTSEVIIQVLKDINPVYPQLPAEQQARLDECRLALENE
ncbi:MAG: PPK2 family polyphosphate kinase [Lachnospiraceae bacterium]